jgi:protein tyrosine phosphatase (PTP) superfamily phosphohydrolase (DUF442 family)
MYGVVALADIRHFLAVSDRLATAGQPTEEQLGEIAATGFEVVVNLGLLDPRYCLADEAGSASRLGLAYHHIPVDFAAPRSADYQRFEATMLANEARRTFVHCAANYRVSCFVALFAEAHLGWSREEGDAHVTRVWQPNEAWQALMAHVRGAR